MNDQRPMPFDVSEWVVLNLMLSSDPGDASIVGLLSDILDVPSTLVYAKIDTMVNAGFLEYGESDPFPWVARKSMWPRRPTGEPREVRP